MGLRQQATVDCFLELRVFQFSMAQVHVRLRMHL